MNIKQDQTMLPFWLVNTLLDDGFINEKIRQAQQRAAEEQKSALLKAWLSDHFSPESLALTNEAQLESGFIFPLLTKLDWHCVAKQVITVQGKQAIPDWCLALDSTGAQTIIKSSGHEAIAAICEAKEWNQKLDTGKAKREENPHHQLQDYLSTLRIRFGFLTNGRLWRLYDTDRITAQKTYLEFDLQCIMSLEDEAEKAVALSLFAFFFGRDAYVHPAENQESRIEQAIVESDAFSLEVEENLKAVIYGVVGEESLFELMGKAIYEANAEKEPSLTSVYENSAMLIFRLLFIVYFEDKNRALLDRHSFYKQHSLGNIYRNLCNQSDATHEGFFALKNLFKILNEGAEDVDFPLFNGGLFDPARAPLLLTPKVFTNIQLRTILEKLLFKTARGETLFDTRRDFKNMSVSHLGRIYEGLLEFRFEKAKEDAVYLEYTSAKDKKPVEAYFDAYDAAHLKKQKGFRALREINVMRGAIYLKSANNSRKSTASYYTPPSLSGRLVQAGIDDALEKAKEQGRELADIKILDNACGSGHFLVESLNYLTDVALERLEYDSALQTLVESEREKIAAQLQSLNLAYEPDDAQILKRALLKRCIYGVDLNLFAVELARLSLWMDSFIFGTPLSFIEHHVQHGNALIGASIADFIAYYELEKRQNDLFVDDLRGRFDELARVMKELDDLRDTTTKEIEQSKRLWRTQIAPRLELLSRALSFISTRALLIAEGEKKEAERLDKTPDLLALLFDESADIKKNEVLRRIADYSARYGFFHYEISFPEAFAGKRKGFDAIIGNPPWDKTKFVDPDFFPQYHSNYRSLTLSEQKKVKDRLLSSGHIDGAYKATVRDMQIKSDYYRERFPLNRGAGDGDVFRFFVERNLELLAPHGSLCYVLPSALMFNAGSMKLRHHIFTEFQMRFFYAFHNKKGIFDIHRDTRFALTQIVKCAPAADAPPIDTAFRIFDPMELNNPQRHISYPLETLKRLSPEQWAMMEIKNAQVFPMLVKCYSAFLPLNKEWLNFRRELDGTNDKALFKEQSSPARFPLYEGEMIWQYNHRYEKPRYWVDTDALHKNLFSKELNRIATDLKLKQKEAVKHSDAIRYECEFIRLGFRDVANSDNERTLILSLLPENCAVVNTIYISIPKRYCLGKNHTVDVEAVSTLRLLFVLAWFNSLPADWLLRFMVEKHASKTFVYRLPIPQPADNEILENPDYLRLTKNAALLTLAASWEDFAEIAPPLKIKRADVPASPKACDKLRAENDRIVARLYGITNDEFAYLLKSFRVMADKSPEYVALLTSNL
jgi:hypothetical protein